MTHAYVFSRDPPSASTSCLRVEQHIAATKHLYVLERGLIFTSPSVLADHRPKFYVSILLSANHTPFGVRTAEDTLHTRAAVLTSACKRHLSAQHAQLVCVYLNPQHPYFAAFRALAIGAHAICREAFRHLDAQLYKAYCGALDVDDARRLLDDIAATAATLLRIRRSPDDRVKRVLSLLQADGLHSLEELSAAVGLSYHRLSHLFAHSVGLSLRSYMLWVKLRNVISLLEQGTTLTATAHAAGFADSSHLCRICHELFGAPPTYFLRNGLVRVRTWRSQSATATG